MRKHFLLLFLMAILPLAGWAEAVDLPSNLAVTFNPMTYNGEDQTADVTIATAKSGSTDIAVALLDVEGCYADQACTNPATVKNAGTYYVKVVGTGATYKTTSEKVFQLTVAKFGNILVSAKALYKVYGENYPTTDFYTAEMPEGAPAADKELSGTIYVPKAEVGLVVTPSFSTWETSKAASVYPFTISVNTVTNYNVVVVDEGANLTINKVNLTVKAKDKTITYGSTPTYEVTYGATLVPGDEDSFGEVTYVVKNAGDQTYEQAEGVVGTYTITPNIAEESANYTFNFETGVLTVNPKALVDNPAQFSFTFPTLVYNGADQQPAPASIAVKDLVLNKDVTFTVNFFTDEDCTTPFDDGNHTNAGTYYAEITANGNYTPALVGVTPTPVVKSFTINQKPLAITTKNQALTYTGAVLALADNQIVYEGLEDVDKEAGFPKAAAFAENVSIKVKTSKPVTYVGTGSDYAIQAYAIKTVGEVVTNINDVTKIFKNYRVAYFNDGILTVNPKELTFTLSDQAMTYGTENNLEIGGTYTPTTDFADYLTVTGFADHDEVVAYPTLTVAAEETSEGSGQYTITANIATMTFQHVDGETATPVAANNYTLTAGSKTTSLLTLVKGNISVRPIDKDIIYGADKPALEVNVSTANLEDKEAAAAILKDAVVIADLATDGLTTYPNAGTYTMSLDLNLIKDNDAYKNLIKNYAIATFTGTYTIAKRDLTKITIADQTVAKTATPATALASLDENLVTFEAGDYKLTDYDKATLKNEFEYVFKDGVNTNAVGQTADAIRIRFVGADFHNFALPAGVELGIDGGAVAGKYVLGKLTVVLSLDDAIVLNPVNKDTWTAADEATRKGYGYKDIKDNKGKIADVEFGNFTMVAERWYTMVLPFNTTVSEVSQALGYAVVNVLNKDNATNDVKFKLWMQDIKANEPFLVKVYKNIDLGDIDMDAVPAEGDAVTFRGKVIEFVETPVVADVTGNQFIGTFMGYQTPSNVDDEYYMATSNGGWYRHGYTRPSGAYLKIASGSGARIFIEEPDGSTTAIETINADGMAVPAEGWYTINGVKLQGVPTEKGIYINNGKKIVVK